jgi:hypothetical protein
LSTTIEVPLPRPVVSPAIVRLMSIQSPGSIEVFSHFATVAFESPVKQLLSPRTKFPTTGNTPSLFLSTAEQLPEMSVLGVKQVLSDRLGKVASK